MALVRKRNYKKIVVYSFVLLALLLAGGYFVYTSMSNGDQAINANISPTVGQPIIKDYGQDFFENEAYKNLIDFGGEKLPLNFEEIRRGRENPFKPF